MLNSIARSFCEDGVVLEGRRVSRAPREGSGMSSTWRHAREFSSSIGSRSLERGGHPARGAHIARYCPLWTLGHGDLAQLFGYIFQHPRQILRPSASTY